MNAGSLSLTIVALLLAACATTGRRDGAGADPANAARSLPAPTTAAVVPAGAPAPAGPGLVLPPGGGERFTYCARPLVLSIKVDSVTAPTTRIVAGTGELRGDEGAATHTGADEVVYVISGSGSAVLGADTVPLRTGTMAFVPEGVPHRIVSSGAEPMTYLWVLGPRASAGAFRRAATVGCPPSAATPTRADTGAAAQASATPSIGRRASVFPSGEGDRITYCLFPLTITRKVDAESAPGARLTAAAGSLRRGAEVGTHRASDEVVYITRGRGRAFIGTDTTAVEAGSVTFVPAGTEHGFVNDSDEPLEYVIVYSTSFSAEGFRRLATRPGPYCGAGSGVR